MAITKTTVTHSLIDPSASPVQRGGTITLGGLVGREWRDIQGMTGDGQVITWEPANADGTGSWSVDLIPNADVANPQNTLYRYLPARGQAVVFEVKTGGPYALADLVVTDPAQWPGLAPTVVGPAGPPNTLTPGTATTGAPGTAMSFDITGTAPNQVLNVTIPRGDDGVAATVDVDPAPVTGAPGSAVAVQNTGTLSAAVFRFTIPQGLTGKSLEYQWSGTQLGVRVEGDATYTYVDLIGPIGPRGVVWQGAWSAATAYAVGDGVAYNGSSYLCIAARSATATTPDADASHWAVLALRGTDGTGAVSSVNGLSPDGTGNVALSAADLSAVPTTRTINGKPLSADVTLGAGDVGATPSGQGVPTGGTTGQVLSKTTGTDYDTEWVDPLKVGTGSGDAMAGDKTASDLGGVAKASGITTVRHGTNGATARPAGADVVWWIGTVEPTNAVAHDVWDDAV